MYPSIRTPSERRAVTGRVLEAVVDRVGVLFLLMLGVSTAGATILVGV